jgi:hypothetical protein
MNMAAASRYGRRPQAAMSEDGAASSRANVRFMRFPLDARSAVPFEHLDVLDQHRRRLLSVTVG